MITLLEIAELLANKLGTEAVYAGFIEADKAEVIGIYVRSPTETRYCISGRSGYQTEKIRILIHWDTDTDSTQKKACAVADMIASLRNEPTGKHTILWTIPQGINLIGKDEKGICEAIVDADIIYEEE